VSNTPFREYKHWVHEGGISTPLIAHWPAGIEARGELRREPGHLIDIMATCVELSGAEHPAEAMPLEGRSLTPVFADKQLGREALFWEHEGNRAIRIGDWKLVARHNRPWELYDISKDRTELNDVADSMPDKVREMSARWDAWAERAGVLPYPPRKIDSP
jgi:arylsulfatase